jgi:phosphate starvation-inducible protein PhoH
MTVLRPVRERRAAVCYTEALRDGSSPERRTAMTQVTLAEEGLDTLFGTQDENLRRIERTFDVTLTARGSEIHINGDP